MCIIEGLHVEGAEGVDGGKVGAKHQNNLWHIEAKKSHEEKNSERTLIISSYPTTV